MSGAGYVLYMLEISHRLNFGLYPVGLVLLAVPSILYWTLKRQADRTVTPTKNSEEKSF
jgi:hypothetical protein